MTQTPAGWYPDPYVPGQPVQRYWDGSTWTEHVQRLADVPPGVKTTPDGQILSGWWMRVAAYLIDGLIYPLVSLPLSLPIVIPLVGEVMDRVRLEQANQPTGAPFLFPGFTEHELVQIAYVNLIQMAVILVYNLVFLRWKGATPGKLILGLRIRLRDAPGPLSWGTVWARVLTQFGYGVLAAIPQVSNVVSIFPLLDDLWPLWDDKKQALHDKVARTNVVRHDRWIQGAGAVPAPGS